MFREQLFYLALELEGLEPSAILIDLTLVFPGNLSIPVSADPLSIHVHIDVDVKSTFSVNADV